MPRESPEQLGPYRIERPLDTGLDATHAYIGLDTAGRRICLQALPRDCLLQGEIHPELRDRLECIRELAHLQVAHLRGVELLDDQPWLIWNEPAGQPLHVALANASSDAVVRLLLRDVAIALHWLHALGIVHGALQPENILVDERSRVTLTRLSPYLYLDPAHDHAHLVTLFQTLLDARPAHDEALQKLLSEADRRESLQVLATSIDALHRPTEQVEDAPVRWSARKRTLLASSCALALAAMVCGYAIYTAYASEQPPAAVPLVAPVPNDAESR